MKNLTKLNRRQGTIIALSLAGICLCAIIALPAMRENIVLLVESILHRNLNVAAWMHKIEKIPLAGIFVILLADYFALTASGDKTRRALGDSAKDFMANIDLKKAALQLAMVFALYVLAYSALLRADFSKVDDMEREHFGLTGWLGWSRYLSEFFSILFYQNFLLSDISPATQIVALVILSLSSLLLVLVMRENTQGSWLALLASLPVGVSPYFFSNMSFKFDSPYMALSLLFCVVPFVFAKNLRSFFAASVLGLLCMLMTYQASSGAYIVIAVVLALKYWLLKEKPQKAVNLFALTAVAAFVCAFVLFKVFFMVTITDDYVKTTVFPFPRIFSGLARNSVQYLRLILSDFNLTAFKVELFLLPCFFVIHSCTISKQSKPLSLLLSLAAAVSITVFSYGAYLILETPGFASNYFTGFGVLLAAMSVFLAGISGGAQTKTPFGIARTVVACALALNCVVITLSFGNALTDQKRYQEFRASLIVADIARFCDNPKEVSVQLENSIGYAPVVRHVAKSFPLVERAIPVHLSKNMRYGYNLFDNYNFAVNRNTPANRTRAYEDYRELDLPVLATSAYHTIRGDGERFLVELK
ncbi:MAG: glucosyltransferase domain-containing protein [Treponematales bacterium]